MTKRQVVLVIPLAILSLFLMTAYSLFIANWPWYVSLYLACALAVTIFTARQSVFIQTSLSWWDESSQSAEEADEMAVSILRDFSIYASIYLVAVSLVYWLVLWGASWLN